jgi:hypothetical protein
LDVASPTVSSGLGGDNDDESDEPIPEEFRDIADIVQAKLHLVSIETDDMVLNSVSDGYHGVMGSFCRLDWNKYKKDPPSLPMFRMLVRQKR